MPADLPRLYDEQTAREVGALLAVTRDLLGRNPKHEADPRDTLGLIAAAVIDELDDPGTPLGADQLLELGIRVQRLAGELQARAYAAQRDLRVRVNQGLNRLRELGSAGELVEVVCDEVIRCCGFSRVLLSRVDGDIWRPSQFRSPRDPRFERSFRTFIEGLDVPLASTPVEAQILRSRRPALVPHAQIDTGPMNHVMRSAGYVVAPVTAAGRVLGLFHADHGDETAVDEVDRDLLWIFAEGFGRIYERTELFERLHEQRSRTSASLRAVEALSAAVDGAAVALARDPDQRHRQPPLPGGSPSPARRALLEELTGREQEVLALMLRGHGNAQIAQQLFITPGTAKTHVSRILRKLGAPNRAAVAGLVLDQR